MNPDENGKLPELRTCASSANRKTRQTAIRLFADQLDSLAELRIRKHRHRCSVASLIREALDQYIEREID